MDTFKQLQELYDAIEEVILSCEDMDIKIGSIENLKQQYNKLKKGDK
tara:strand:+ start:773 stop:913 length:141 start_codon:yes stop_codon:yes gene_type:complete